MNKEGRELGRVAVDLARNPLGIIALFLVLVYGMASLVTLFVGGLSHSERLPLIYFLAIFPVLVLGCFLWLVTKHSFKLFAPGDFKDEGNYVQLMEVVGSLGAATAKSQVMISEMEIRNIAKAVKSFDERNLTGINYRKNNILWVDDRPENNAYERQAFEAMGFRFTLALSTDEALERVAQTEFAAIISDMGRRESPREGYVLLDKLRNEGNNTPLYFYASSNAPKHKQETEEHRGQGCTNNPQELFEMVIKGIIKG